MVQQDVWSVTRVHEFNDWVNESTGAIRQSQSRIWFAISSILSKFLPVKPPSAILNMNLALNPFLSSFLLSSMSSRVSLSPFSRPSGTSSLLASSVGGDGNMWKLKQHDGIYTSILSTWPVVPLFFFCHKGVIVPLSWRLPWFFARLHCGYKQSWPH